MDPFFVHQFLRALMHVPSLPFTLSFNVINEHITVCSVNWDKKLGLQNDLLAVCTEFN